MADNGGRRGNVELKARCRDLGAARTVCEELGAEFAWEATQTDTYFATGNYRMKLRESSLGTSEMVWYSRENAPGARKSSYRLMPVSDPAEKKRIFAADMGIKVVVTKSRALWLWRGVRIHLDRVEGLGDFLEFEAVLGDELSEVEGHRLVKQLIESFEIDVAALVPVSYSDLMLRRSRRSRPRGPAADAGRTSSPR